MEARFLRADGDLACKLMAALQGANMTGADSRCASNGTSSLFAFVKVAQPDDVFGEPSFLLSVRTHANAGIEPIDSLQVKFDAVHECSGVGVDDKTDALNNYGLYPNPIDNTLTVEIKVPQPAASQIEMVSLTGNIMYQGWLLKKIVIDVSGFPKGVYFVRISGESGSCVSKVVKR
jgi:hypothetical protein